MILSERIFQREKAAAKPLTTLFFNLLLWNQELAMVPRKPFMRKFVRHPPGSSRSR